MCIEAWNLIWTGIKHHLFIYWLIRTDHITLETLCLIELDISLKMEHGGLMGYCILWSVWCHFTNIQDNVMSIAAHMGKLDRRIILNEQSKSNFMFSAKAVAVL